MHMDPTRKRWRAEDVRALPADGNRYEVIRGTLLVTPAPRPVHQNAVFELARLLAEYCERTRIGRMFFAPAEVEFDDETLVQPDIFVVPGREGPVPSSWRMMPKPVLAVEVISPSSARHDRGRKRRLYSEERVAEYWIVDTDSRMVERWLPGDGRPEVLDARLPWQPDPAHAALEIDLVAYFAAVWGD